MTKSEVNKAKIAFRAHRSGAFTRGITFNFSFEEWLGVWIISGHWDERGPHSGEYCMSRYGDTGPYELKNVFIQLHSSNVSQGQIGKRKARGESCGHNKIKQVDALTIKNSNKSAKELSKEFNVSDTLIRKIKKGVLWT